MRECRGRRSTRLFICCRIGAPRCLFPLSDFAGQKTKVTQEFFERLGGTDRHKIGHIGQKPVTALNKSYSPPSSFFLQKESKQRKTLTIYIFFFSIARCSYSARRTAYSSCAAGLPFAA